MQKESLIKKYNVPAPRYTSYPTVPFWDGDQPEKAEWFKAVKDTFDRTNRDKGISLYFHMPFCESLCTYCGCNKRITKNHSVEERYVAVVLKEWETYLKVLGERPLIQEIHIGGGTPTFFSPENYRWMFGEISKSADYGEGHDFSFEGHPNNTTEAHLEAFRELGFNRVSYGVQDFDLKVQQTINRIQPYKNVKIVTDASRKLGYESVNFDLVYGLPFQTLDVIRHTINKVAELMPDRIAFYSYAHVPWVSPGQRAYTEADLPSDSYKRELYELGKSMLLELGYKDIGMDHFALEHDDLYKAFKEERLHRNFMGYTTNQTELMIGMGCSSISDAKTAFAQNIKKVEDYEKAVNETDWAVYRGHFLSKEDSVIREAILELICHNTLALTPEIKETLDKAAWDQLEVFKKEGIITLEPERVSLTELGLPFIRNVCTVFDARLRRKKISEDKPIFSKSI
ncbi:coproporphyrinogen-III oxidase [Fulvitalea axinellae]|uniref:Coproporphyrinogen-III oxidase n=1 Tax=Fulvitalea axinellae TaxID=1182444 RepID=A0AAU9CFF3_9BACT|nr:coproporphyrinogen-III oxidase [Fulvitalea axinellae]